MFMLILTSSGYRVDELSAVDGNMQFFDSRLTSLVIIKQCLNCIAVGVNVG